MINFDIPILLIIFNRPRHTEIVFETLKVLKPTNLYIFCDGPRENHFNDKINVNKSRNIVLDINWKCNVKTLFNENNLGCKLAVRNAIDWLFDTENYGIILEDDCLPEQSFYYFCAELLIKYMHDSRIMHIGGFNQHNSINEIASYGFTLNNFVWGWATWKRAWQLHDKNLADLEEFIDKKYFLNISQNRLNMRKMHTGLRCNLSNDFKSWVAPWQYSIWKNGGLGIFPTKNLVKNIGFDDSGTSNTNKNLMWSNTLTYKIDFPLIHPKFIMRHPYYDFRSQSVIKKIFNFFKLRLGIQY